MTTAQQAEYEAAQKELRALIAGKRQPNILIVEDDADDAELLQGKLGARFSNVRLCNDGHAAVRMILQTSFDLVFIDLGLPHLSGVQVMKQTKAHRPETKFIVVTGRGYEFLNEALELAGITIILNKPVTEDDLDELFGELRV